ncbi:MULTISPECIES: HWE histidine kinase domain-containing protein [unclassified Phenylobacterium]|uniref:HWE histidine kinase domain-containing protein n=1 Tax=unclassified Phenylobacterium TaxID=2640670 RepID=UPI00083A8786|nr:MULTISPECIES: HWE histidine kinase domain-containing protein [unclassified Phenylobacterium]
MTDRFAALDLSPNAYAVVDADLRMVWVNNALARQADVPRDQLIGRRVFDGIPAYNEPQNLAARELVRRSVAKALATGETDRTPLYAFDPQGGAQVFLTVSHTPIADEDGQVRSVLAHVVEATDVVRLQTEGYDAARPPASLPEVASYIVSSALNTQAANRTLMAETERLRQMFEQAPGFMALLVGPDHTFALVNAAYRRLVGNRELIGRPARDGVADIYDQGYGEILDQVRRTGEAFVGSEMSLVTHQDSVEPLHKYVDFVFQPLIDEAGEVFGIFLQGQEVTERVNAARTQNLLVRELRHRVKNTLATVRAIATRTARTAETPESFIKALETRLIALSTAHELLTQGRWERVPLRDLVEGELRPFDLSRISIEGPDACLPARVAMPMGLAVHELATNAAKHGALSVSAGSVDIAWWVIESGPSRSLRFTWIERGGPPVTIPERRGFGTEILDGLMRRGAEPVLDYAREGLRCTLDIPLDDLPNVHPAQRARDAD